MGRCFGYACGENNPGREDTSRPVLLRDLLTLDQHAEVTN
jgi:hypothetical protein